MNERSNSVDHGGSKLQGIVSSLAMCIRSYWCGIDLIDYYFMHMVPGSSALRYVFLLSGALLRSFAFGLCDILSNPRSLLIFVFLFPLLSYLGSN